MNDLEKPIVAQIYRLWQDEAGKKWINACWYYRPEQTIHRVTKRFYRNEVMKTGQYRDHRIDDIVDRCFVMFHTRYHKGRPRGLPLGKEVYVCEARYNEDKFTFNRIKTWTSCLPDEVRERDYEMDLYDVARKIRKEPTPIAHLLDENAKETDAMPKPNWGHKDAPPIIGGVHIRPREPNVSQVLVPIIFCLSFLHVVSRYTFHMRQRRHQRRVQLHILCLECLGRAKDESTQGSWCSHNFLIASDSLNLALHTPFLHPSLARQSFPESSLPLERSNKA